MADSKQHPSNCKKKGLKIDYTGCNPLIEFLISHYLKMEVIHTNGGELEICREDSFSSWAPSVDIFSLFS